MNGAISITFGAAPPEPKPERYKEREVLWSDLRERDIGDLDAGATVMSLGVGAAYFGGGPDGRVQGDRRRFRQRRITVRTDYPDQLIHGICVAQEHGDEIGIGPRDGGGIAEAYVPASRITHAAITF